MKAIILARVSTEEQKLEGQSLPAQLIKSREYADRKQLIIKSEYEFDESSTKDHRAKFEKVIQEIKKSNEPIALIVETVDRLQRSFKESVLLDEFRKAGKLELHFIRENLVIHKNSNSSEIQRWDLAVFVAKSYVLQISDNVKRTIDKKLQSGEIVGRAPIGYLNERDEYDKANVIVDGTRAHIIVRIYELYATGNYSMATIAEMVGKDGLRSSKNRVMLRARQIEAILNNPFYHGYQLYREQLYPHKYPCLITQDLFDQCKRVRQGYKERRTKHASDAFIFKGLIVCKNCGCTVSPEKHKQGRYILYSCTNSKKVCQRLYVNEAKLLEPVEQVFRDMYVTDETIEEITQALKVTEEAKNLYQKQQLKTLRDEHDKIENWISVMYEDRLDGRITRDQYDQLLKEYKQKQASVLAKLNQYNKASEEYYITANTILNLAQRAFDIFQRSETEEKRQLLNFVFQNMQLDQRELVFSVRKPFDTLVESNPRPTGGDRRDSNPRPTVPQTAALPLRHDHHRTEKEQCQNDT